MIFTITSRSKGLKARTGILSFSDTHIQTPIFMPIGTQGSVKGLSWSELRLLGYDLILGNTYHLWQRPGLDVMGKAGGLHSFIAWDKVILTDSGGYQAFSLSKLRKFTEEGVWFRSSVNGSEHFLSPEESMRIQTVLGSNIALVLDECLPAEVTYDTAVRAMWRTRRWAERSKDAFEHYRSIQPHENVLFGIPQGAQFVDLRKESAYLTMELGFEGYSIGGVANGGEPEEMMYEQVDTQTGILEEHKPRHLLGVGTPKDVVQMVARGIDMFDCVYPTRNARHGSIFANLDDRNYQLIRIQSSKYERDFSPINPNSVFEELRKHSKAYLRHLFKTKEILGYRLATLNNVEFYANLMQTIRGKIQSGVFETWWNTYNEYSEK